MSRLQNTVEMTVILGISVLVAILVPEITTIFGISGSTGSVMINFIVPGLMCILKLVLYGSSGGIVT